MRKSGSTFLAAIAVGLAMGSGAVHAATKPGSLGADGWASYGTNNLGQPGTTGGYGAIAVKTYNVTNRNQLIQALYGNTATIAADGSFSGTLDSSRKVIYVSGTISLNANKALVERTADDYIAMANAANPSGCPATTFDAFWTAYLNAYKPPFATVPANTPGTPEATRVCAAGQQRRVVVLTVPSNTSIIGLGAAAKIIHGTLLLSGLNAANSVDNIVIRNIGFEDAFDFFPQWDPTDSTNPNGRWNSAYDNVTSQYVTHVWIDHNTFSDGDRPDSLYPSVWPAPNNAKEQKVQHHDGLTDVVNSANYVTLSFNHYHDHDKTSLVGGSDTASLTNSYPGVLKTTYHHNYFQNVTQRLPRVRYGMVHVYSNYYRDDGTSFYHLSQAWFAGQSAKMYLENNAIDIIGSTAPLTKVISSGNSTSAANNCAALAGMTVAYCAQYIYDTGTVLNGASINASAQAKSANAALTVTPTPWPSAASPTTTPTAVPRDYYPYSLDSGSDLPTSIPARAGVGKL